MICKIQSYIFTINKIMLMIFTSILNGINENHNNNDKNQLKALFNYLSKLSSKFHLLHKASLLNVIFVFHVFFPERNGIINPSFSFSSNSNPESMRCVRKHSSNCSTTSSFHLFVPPCNIITL